MDTFDFAGKKALVRVDLNLPQDAAGKVTDDTRARTIVPTVHKILKDGGSAILMSHLGRPKGKVNPAMSLKPIAEHRATLLGKPVLFATDCIGPDAKAKAALLIPTVAYGFMFFGQHMPKSEASKKGLSFGEMFKDVGILGALIVCYLLTLFFQGALGLSPAAAYAIGGVLLIVVSVMTKFSVGSFLLFTLFIVHAMVGAVELGTDGWIQNITGTLVHFRGRQVSLNVDVRHHVQPALLR